MILESLQKMIHSHVQSNYYNNNIIPGEIPQVESGKIEHTQTLPQPRGGREFASGKPSLEYIKSKLGIRQENDNEENIATS